MIFTADDLSKFEFCPRYPQINRIFEPPRWPIRDGVKNAFAQGIRGMVSGFPASDYSTYFIDKAANPGFTYTEKTTEIYTQARDYASWLEGALSLVKSEHGQMNPVQLYKIGNHQLDLDAWEDSEGVIRLFRIASSLGSRVIRWPELCASALTGKEITIEVYRLPSLRDGRVVSPLCMGFQHPTFNINLRLARLYDEPEFGPNWKKIARWELSPSCSWDEWKIGIERDKCIDQIREVYTLSPILDVEERRKIVFDIEHMTEVMERPDLWPRYREACQRCVFVKLCHGNEDERSSYTPYPENLSSYEKKLIKNIG